MNDEYTSKLLIPPGKTVVKPEVAKEETKTGKKRESAQLKVGRKILGFDVVGEVGKQKQSFKNQKASRTGTSLNITKKFKDDKGGVSAEFFKRKDKDPFGSEDSKGFNVGATFTFEGGGLSEKQAKELDFDGDGRISASDLKAKREGKFSRGGRAAIRGFKFGGIF